jgi:CDP-diacylglycerol--serine O-phosphatidyltransferase
LQLAAVCLFVASILDFLDVFIARALKATSNLGAQLDSLADMVTFGVLPGFILFHELSIAYGEYFQPINTRPASHLWVQSLSLLFIIAAALRLARFNLSKYKGEYFQGLPTPAAAILVASIPFVMHYQYQINLYFEPGNEQLGLMVHLKYWRPFDFHLVYNLFNPVWWGIASVFLSLLMVSKIPMLNFKIRSFSFKDNKDRVYFLIISGVLILIGILPYWVYIPSLPFLDYLLIPIIILLYIIFGFYLYLKGIRT